MEAKINLIKFGETNIMGIQYTKEAFKHLIDKDIDIPVKDRLGKVTKGRCTRLTIDGVWLVATVELFDWVNDISDTSISLTKSKIMKKVKMGYISIGTNKN